MTKAPVLDASVILAFLQGEKLSFSGEAAIRPGAKLGAVNLCEVYGKLIDRGMDPGDARTAVDKLQLEVVPFDEDLSYRAAFFRTIMPKHISLADRACLALAESCGGDVYTCDREWLALGTAAQISMAR